METLVKGDVVVATFPFSDLASSKKRPALVLASFPKNRVILCQITSQQSDDAMAVALHSDDFKTGNLRTNSFARPRYVFTADESLIAYRAGVLKTEKLQEVVDKLVAILKTE